LSYKPVVLVTLGGCHLLNGLVVVSIEARKKFVRCFGEGFMRGIVLAPREPRRATLVKRDAKGDKWFDQVRTSGNLRDCLNRD
jgi:hypothetical protein